MIFRAQVVQIVVDRHQIESLRWCGGAGEGAVALFDHACHIARFESSASHIDEGSRDRADHVV